MAFLHCAYPPCRRSWMPALPTSLRLPALLLAMLPLNALAAEQWIVATDLWGNRNYQTLHLDVQGGRIAGRLDADPVTAP